MTVDNSAALMLKEDIGIIGVITERRFVRSCGLSRNGMDLLICSWCGGGCASISLQSIVVMGRA
jgi:hypothetical protein